MSHSIICNFSSFCVDCDCPFHHNLSLKDRKIVRKLYDSLPNLNKVEPNPSIRKANCRFGQLCFNPDCNFRHRLSFNSRSLLSKQFNNAKLDNTKVEKIPSTPIHPSFIISTSNSFLSLDIPLTPPPTTHKISWADIVGDNDDNFYMKF